MDRSGSPMGQVSLKGTFVDKQGKPWGKIYAENQKTVLRGMLIINKENENKLSKTLDFLYWNGAGD